MASGSPAESVGPAQRGRSVRRAVAGLCASALASAGLVTAAFSGVLGRAAAPAEPLTAAMPPLASSRPAPESDFSSALPEAADGAGWIARWGDAAERHGARLQAAQLQVTSPHPERFGQTSLQVHLDGTYAALLATMAAVSRAPAASMAGAGSAGSAGSTGPSGSAGSAAAAASAPSSTPAAPIADAVVWRQLRLEPPPDATPGGLTARVELVLLTLPPAVRP